MTIGWHLIGRCFHEILLLVMNFRIALMRIFWINIWSRYLTTTDVFLVFTENMRYLVKYFYTWSLESWQWFSKSIEFIIRGTVRSRRRCREINLYTLQYQPYFWNWSECANFKVRIMCVRANSRPRSAKIEVISVNANLRYAFRSIQRYPYLP